MTSVTIPNSVKSIGDNAFSYCSGLTSVTIGNSVTSIGWGAFSYCTGLTSVHISDIAAWCNIDFARSDSNPLYYAHHLYLNGEEVKDLVIPNSVTSIGEEAFYNCSALTSVTIGNGVTSIGAYAFDGCSALTSVTIGNSVESIWYGAFANCPELLDVYCYAEKVPSTKSDAFDGSYPEYATLHVPDASIDSYKASAPWSGFGKIVGLSGDEPEQPEVPEVEKCATPVVTYAEGKLSFSCETEGAEFVTKLVAEDAKEYYDAEIELSLAYNIEVYATKANCENSDTVSVTLVWMENGKTGEENGVISVEAAPVLIQGNNGSLTISGTEKGTKISVYTISGEQVATATATDGSTTLNTGLQHGTVVIVRIGNKSVKIKI